MATTPTTTFDLDDDARTRAAAREGRGDSVTFRFRGETYALPVELPIDVLEPVRTLDIGALLVAIVPDEKGEVSVSEILSLLIRNPTLPTDVTTAIGEAMRRLFGEDQYARFWAARPSVHDLRALAQKLGSAYGVSLGESTRSPDTSGAGGATLSQTSDATTALTPVTPSQEPLPVG
jgi:hypothetical protein